VQDIEGRRAEFLLHRAQHELKFAPVGLVGTAVFRRADRIEPTPSFLFALGKARTIDVERITSL